MIYGSSTDPIYIKKIKVKIWYLRDEIEAVVQKMKDDGIEVGPEEIQKLKEEYQQTTKLVREGDFSADLAEAPIAEAEDAEAAPEEDAPEVEAASEEETTEDNKGGEVIYITQRIPTIPKEKVHDGIIILSELEMGHLYFFSNKGFIAGESVVVEFCVPKRFVVNLDIAFCRKYNMKSRIISENRHPHRVAAKFTFLKAGERTLLRNFINSIEPDIPDEVELPKASNDDGGDEFDELEGLDL